MLLLHVASKRISILRDLCFILSLVLYFFNFNTLAIIIFVVAVLATITKLVLAKKINKEWSNFEKRLFNPDEETKNHFEQRASEVDVLEAYLEETSKLESPNSQNLLDALEAACQKVHGVEYRILEKRMMDTTDSKEIRHLKEQKARVTRMAGLGLLPALITLTLYYELPEAIPLPVLYIVLALSLLMVISCIVLRWFLIREEAAQQLISMQENQATDHDIRSFREDAVKLKGDIVAYDKIIANASKPLKLKDLVHAHLVSTGQQ
ncbi:hypothetical protein ACT3UJ_06300 [Halomonas sp. 86]|uniref:hypothetical protein n=1 Tax=unclassified Halomonas TaxID=2609666 RepID=UPI0040348202